jgi:sRNA-binding protein
LTLDITGKRKKKERHKERNRQNLKHEKDKDQEQRQKTKLQKKRKKNIHAKKETTKDIRRKGRVKWAIPRERRRDEERGVSEYHYLLGGKKLRINYPVSVCVMSIGLIVIETL